MFSIKRKLPELIFLVLFISTGLISNYGALDRIATQWLYLSVINTLGLIYFLNDKKFIAESNKVFQFKPFIFLVLFIAWGLISYFYALNQEEVIVKAIRWVQLPISLFILLNFFKSDYLTYVKVISVIVSSILIVELYFTYSTYFQLTQLSAYDFTYAFILKGATGNKNINAASLLIKTPFLIYLISLFRNHLIKYSLAGVLIMTTYMVFILSSRSSIIALFFVISMLIFRYIYLSVRNKSMIKDTSYFLILGGLLFSVMLFSVRFNNTNSASIIKRASTVNLEDTSTQQRLRFYQHSLDQTLNNLIIGVGLGNWKIKSVDYDKKDVVGYTIPYHTHNDFLEISSELGIIGLILYLLIFIFPFLGIFQHKEGNKLINVNTIILLAGIIYFIDANLQFPHARPVMQVPFILILVLAYIHNNRLKDA